MSKQVSILKRALIIYVFDTIPGSKTVFYITRYAQRPDASVNFCQLFNPSNAVQTAEVVKNTGRNDKMRYQIPKSQDRNDMQEITASELKAQMDAGADIQLIDVRQPDEYAFARIEGAKLIPLGEIIARMNEIDPNRDTVIHCKMGGRSARAIEALQRSGYEGNLMNLAGGITAWSNEVDPSVAKY
jgi:rhodanese-related sulfurtransferase